MVNEQFTIIMILLFYRIQVKIPTTKLKRNPTLNKMLTRVWTGSFSNKSSGIPECIEKYLKASDFVKALVDARK
jgi:hypothetical protein